MPSTSHSYSASLSPPVGLHYLHISFVTASLLHKHTRCSERASAWKLSIYRHWSVRLNNRKYWLVFFSHVKIGSSIFYFKFLLFFYGRFLPFIATTSILQRACISRRHSLFIYLRRFNNLKNTLLMSLLSSRWMRRTEQASARANEGLSTWCF